MPKKSLLEEYFPDEKSRTRLYLFIWSAQISAMVALFIGGCTLIFKALQYMGVI
jgi:hypothetical protein